MSPTRFAVGAFLAVVLAVPSRADESDDAKQAAEIQAKIAELQKQLDALKKLSKAPAAKKPLTLADAVSWRLFAERHCRPTASGSRIELRRSRAKAM